MLKTSHKSSQVIWGNSKLKVFLLKGEGGQYTLIFTQTQLTQLYMDGVLGNDSYATYGVVIQEWYTIDYGRLIHLMRKD